MFYNIIKNVLSANKTYAVCLKTDNRAIGSIGLITPAQSHTRASNAEIEVGYWIGVPYWGNGYSLIRLFCTESIIIILDM